MKTYHDTDMDMERFSRNITTTGHERSHRLRGALLGSFLASLSVSHEGLQAAEISEDTSWGDGVYEMLRAQEQTGHEQLNVGLLQTHDGKDEFVWLPTPIKSSGEGHVNVSEELFEEVLPNAVKSMNMVEELAFCHLHTHPKGDNDEFTIPPSGTDFLSFAPEIEIEDVAIPVRAGVVAAEGVYYYGEYPEDVFVVYDEQREELLRRVADTSDSTVITELFRVVRARENLAELESIEEMTDVLVGYLQKQRSPEIAKDLLSPEALNQYQRSFLSDHPYQWVEDMSYDEKATFVQHAVNRHFSSMATAVRGGWDYSLDRLQDALRTVGFDVRFVPTEQLAQEQICAGLEGDQYMYDGAAGLWVKQ